MLDAGTSGDAGPLTALATADCSECRSVERDSVHGFEAGNLQVVVTQPATGAEAADVVVYATHDVILKISHGGETTKDVVTDPAPLRMRLMWTDAGWRVADIDQVDHVPADNG